MAVNTHGPFDLSCVRKLMVSLNNPSTSLLWACGSPKFLLYVSSGIRASDAVPFLDWPLGLALASSFLSSLKLLASLPQARPFLLFGSLGGLLLNLVTLAKLVSSILNII